MTVALTPSIRLSFFSIRAAHEAQVMPPMASSTSEVASPAAAVPAVPDAFDALDVVEVLVAIADHVSSAARIPQGGIADPRSPVYP
ncbi:hypothetical protein GCM10022245_72950 [Streptomyces mayteni]